MGNTTHILCTGTERLSCPRSQDELSRPSLSEVPSCSQPHPSQSLAVQGKAASRPGHKIRAARSLTGKRHTCYPARGPHYPAATQRGLMHLWPLLLSFFCSRGTGWGASKLSLTYPRLLSDSPFRWDYVCIVLLHIFFFKNMPCCCLLFKCLNAWS